MDNRIMDKTIDYILQAKHTVVLTGAGISTESGVPDFRSPGGIWERYDPTVFFYDRFLADPELVWKCMLDMHENTDFTLWDAKPNKGHTALAYLEEIGLIKAIITQNIDNLHQKAGSNNVIEFHGNMLFARCTKCSKTYGYKEVLHLSAKEIPPRCSCRGILKPDAVFFGESIPAEALNESFRHAEDCDLMIVIGTSAQVEPAASLPFIAKGMNSMMRGFRGIPIEKSISYVIEINYEKTPLTGTVSDFIIQEKAGEALNYIADKIREIKGMQ